MTIDRDTPFRIAVLGDFSGRHHRGDHEPKLPRRRTSKLRPLQIDRDNFEMVMRKLDVRLEGLVVIPDAGPLTLRFEDLDDFEPDDLYEELSLFSSLRDLRERLSDDETFQAAAEEVLAWGQTSPGSDASPPKEPAARNASNPQSASGPPARETVSSEGLLDQLLESSSLPANQSAQSEWQSLINEVVAPYLVPGADPRQAELISCVDAATQATMTALLHHASFRALESAWRALYLLVHRLETDSQLSVHLIDITKLELAEDLLTADDLRATNLFRMLVEQSVETPGGEPWSLLVGNYTLNPTDEDATLLSRLGQIAAAAGAPLLTSAGDQLVGCSGSADFPTLDPAAFANSAAWQALQKSAEAAYLGLTWPRFLLRLPYGAQTNPIEEFEYEELLREDNGQKLLWGNSAFLAALVLGESYSEAGWEMSPKAMNQIDRLPVWVFEDEGESHIHPCGEFLLTDSLIAGLQTQGIIPLVSIRDHDEVRIGGFYSLQSKLLAGRWNQ